MRHNLCALGIAGLVAGCTGLNGHDEFSNYGTRKDTITTSAGDAQAQNIATQTNSFWPRYVGDRRLEMNGERAAKAVECYRAGKSQPTGGTTTVSQGQAQTNGNTTTSSATSQTTPNMSKGC